MFCKEMQEWTSFVNAFPSSFKVILFGLIFSSLNGNEYLIFKLIPLNNENFWCHIFFLLYILVYKALVKIFSLKLYIIHVWIITNVVSRRLRFVFEIVTIFNFPTFSAMAFIFF